MQVSIGTFIFCMFFEIFLIGLTSIRETKKFSKNNIIELNCYKPGEDELHIIEKKYDKALNLKSKYEKEGWVVVLTITTKSAGLIK